MTAAVSPYVRLADRDKMKRRAVCRPLPVICFLPLRQGFGPGFLPAYLSKRDWLQFAESGLL